MLHRKKPTVLLALPQTIVVDVLGPAEVSGDGDVEILGREDSY